MSETTPTRDDDTNVVVVKSRRAARDFYRRRVGPLLAERIARAIGDADVDPLSSFDLTEELAIVRNVGADAVEMYDTVVTAREIAKSRGEEEKVKELDGFLLAAGKLAGEAMGEVAHVAEKGMKVAAARLATAVGVEESVIRVIEELVTCALHVFGDDPRVMELEAMIRLRCGVGNKSSNGDTAPLAESWTNDPVHERQLIAMHDSVTPPPDGVEPEPHKKAIATDIDARTDDVGIHD